MPTLKLSEILLPVDFSDKGKLATHYATALARHFDATLTLLHVNEVYSPALVAPRELYGPIDTGWISALEAERLKELHTYQEGDLQDLKVQRVVVSGDPAQRITDHARKEKTSLIVMPTHGYGPFRRFLLGSVTAKVLHDVACPVWTGAHLSEAPRHGGQEVPVENLLCAIDNGPASERVLTWARDFASEFGARITVVHAAHVLGRRTEEASEQIRCLLKKLGVRGEIEIVVDDGDSDTGKSVAAVAAKLNADVVVIGRSPDATGLGRLRANAYAIIRQSPCPVISV